MQWASKLLELTGLKRVWLMVLCGAGAALSLAPVHAVPLIFPAYGLLFYYLCKTETRWQAFRLSWWWGFGFFLTGLYWISIALTTDLVRFGWMIPLSLLGLNGGFAIFTALAGLGFYTFKRANSVINWLLFSTIFYVSEWLRGHILTGFPWNLPGYVWGATDISMQAANMLSIYPLTFITILLASSCALWRYRLIMIASLSFIYGVHMYGYQRLQTAEPYESASSMRLVQANIPQELKWDQQYLLRSLGKHIDMSQADADVIVWSESAFPFPINVHEPVPKEPFAWLKKDQTLITGAVLANFSAEPPIFWNSIIALNHKAEIVARYDKRHLVPFGEYVPLSDVLPIEKIVSGIGEFEVGQNTRSIKAGNMTMHPLVCYEIIFPEYAKSDSPRSAILNLTNDDWFGYSFGPYQHLMMTRFRAVEQQTPVIRVANSGITAVIDAYGRIQESIPLHEEGVIDLTPYTDRRLPTASHR